MRRKFVLGGLVLALAATAPRGWQRGTVSRTFRVAFIYPGPHNDGGWSQSTTAGRLAIGLLEQQGGTTCKENIFSTRRYRGSGRGPRARGYDMIFGCSFGMFENGVNGQLYSRYPDVLFEQATGLQVKRTSRSTSAPGEDTITFREWRRAPRPGRPIGYIVPFGDSRGRAPHQRVRARGTGMNPKAKVRLPGRTHGSRLEGETAAAKNLIAAGVDVLGQNVDSPAQGSSPSPKGSLGRLRLTRKSAPTPRWLTAATYS